MYLGKDGPGGGLPPQDRRGCLKGVGEGGGGRREGGWDPPKGQVSSAHGDHEKDPMFLRPKTATWVPLEVSGYLASRCLNTHPPNF